MRGLTGVQARWLRDARDTDGGVYVPLIGTGPEPYQLVEGGAAIMLEVHGSWRQYKWTDRYLVPTPLGLELLTHRYPSRT